MAQTPPDHQALFNARLLERVLPQAPVPPAHQQLLDEWAEAIRSGAIRQRSEQQIRGPFIQKFFVEMLGYVPFASASEFTVTHEARTGTGSADVALGRFGAQGDEVVAPVELKGADTPNLDIMMPGRQKSPVQQVWEYAMDTPNCKFLVLSNMLEIRLYAVGHTRRVYERFDLLEVADNPRHYHRLLLLLGADQLLGGGTAQLLDESARVEKEITRALYQDYKSWRIQLITELAQANAREPGALIAPAQKLLDRVLFVAFAQQRGLLPANTLQDVHHTNNPWNPSPRWSNYLALFRAVDKGLPQRNIPPYNGGLFAPDAMLDTLVLPDGACDVFLELSKYDFGGEVSVSVLGHIFEQSITDLEQLQELAEAGVLTLQAIEAQTRGGTRAVSGARKDQGIVYTPEFITTFIVEKTLGKTIESRRQSCAVRYQISSDSQPPESWAWRKPSKEEAAYAKKLAQPGRVVELAFWRDWLAELTTLKVCDPACGSGAFLVAAFDLLLLEYQNVNEQIAAITGSMEVFHADKEILNSNLFGVDLNAESIEITKLSLWLKTARHGKPLESLEANLRVGNSIISSADGGLDYDPKAFDWSTAFPEIVARGGFDVVLGNPPYVRMERLKAFRPYLEQRYAVAAERADLYGYFFELALRLLRNGSAGGRIGFISSSTFFKTGAGKKLRQYLLDNAQIEVVVDFGDLQVFEGVTTYPAIFTARRSGAPQPEALIEFLNVKTALPQDFAKAFKEATQTMPQGRLTADSWQFESDALAQVRAKVLSGHKTLKEIYGAPLFGIKTGLNEAFVVSRAVRDQLVESHYRSAELLRPFLEGKDLRKWRNESRDLWLIYIPKGQIDIDDYPAIKAYLIQFKDQLEARATKQAWFELQQPQEAYKPLYEGPKVSWGRFQPEPLYSFDAKGLLGNDNVYCIPKAGFFETAVLNSSVIWFVTKQICPPVSGGFYPVRGTFAENFPIPEVNPADREKLATLAEAAQTAAEARRDEIRRFGHTVLRDLVPGGLQGDGKLPAVWDAAVPDFAEFTTELRKRYKRELTLGERNDWEVAVAQARQQVAQLTQDIQRLEREIDAIVYRLFNLTPREIALIETK